MAQETLQQRLNGYITSLFVEEDDALRWIQAEAERNDLPRISLAPFEARLLQLLIKAVGARTVVEIGTLAGYSGTWVARALPPDGKLYTLEKSAKHALVAYAAFQRAGVLDRIELIEGDALPALQKLGERAPFDFVFIDADKKSYPAYLEWAIEHVRPGGMIAAHNALRAGRVLAPEGDDDRAMDSFNRMLAAETRLDSTIIGVGDGFAIGVKR